MRDYSLTTEPDPAETMKRLNNYMLLMIVLPFFLITAYKMPDAYLPLLLSISIRQQYHSTLPSSLAMNFLFIMICCQALKFVITSAADVILYFGSKTPTEETRFGAWSKLVIIGLILFVVVAELSGRRWDAQILDDLADFANEWDFTRAKLVLEHLQQEHE